MNIEKFQKIALRLSNQMFVRHYLWINYPNNPQEMAIQLRDPNPTAGCDMLQKELMDYGFRWDFEFSGYVVERTGE